MFITQFQVLNYQHSVEDEADNYPQCEDCHDPLRAGRSSEVERSLMVRWVVGSILHGVDPLSYFSFQPVLHDWCNKGRGMCYPVCGMVHIKEPLLLIDKSSLCGGSGFPFSLSEWSLTICLTPYNRRLNVLSASLNKTFLSDPLNDIGPT